jgi:hypothetical protein
MEKEEIIKRIKEGEKNTDKILSWVTCLPNSTGSRKPTIIRVGDVFMHPIFRHPYVILEKKRFPIHLCSLNLKFRLYRSYRKM